MEEKPKRMDFIPPNQPILFPFQQGDDELFFQASSTHHHNLQHKDPPQDDMLLMPPSLHFTTNDPSLNLDITGVGGGGRLNPIPNSFDETCSNEKIKKRIMHRDLERQRRQEMTTLYASLRSLLPLQYLKGKRAISDHMNEAANYINDMRNRIQLLSGKRDELLRNIPNSGATATADINCPLPQPPPPAEYFVTVQPCLDGVEVIISSSGGLRGNGEEFHPLSRVLRVLVDHGFSVISCVSTTKDERSFHTIRSEVSDLTTVDLYRLQQILTDLMASSSSRTLDSLSMWDDEGQ
ncbi:transcription factor bHLH120-like [Telopea speciosissima]|uniref:transcription factor bHLH120-like n=1 Tax=Telopea speciosissima TaxID=54955 RepID=UPI001CC39D4F|nr:transcription factor bHLH120-like [Telopea speciosissima]